MMPFCEGLENFLDGDFQNTSDHQIHRCYLAAPYLLLQTLYHQGTMVPKKIYIFVRFLDFALH
jgi:hypothetical protein